MVEHGKLKQEVTLLQKQVDNDLILQNNLLAIDTLRETQLRDCKQTIENLEKERQSLEKSLKIDNYVIGGSLGVAFVCLFLLCLK